MTRKDYVLIADAIATEAKFAGSFNTKEMRLAILREVACALADVLKRDNSRFDRTRFLTACGV